MDAYRFYGEAHYRSGWQVVVTWFIGRLNFLPRGPLPVRLPRQQGSLLWLWPGLRFRLPLRTRLRLYFRLCLHLRFLLRPRSRLRLRLRERLRLRSWFGFGVESKSRLRLPSRRFGVRFALRDFRSEQVSRLFYPRLMRAFTRDQLLDRRLRRCIPLRGDSLLGNAAHGNAHHYRNDGQC